MRVTVHLLLRLHIIRRVTGLQQTAGTEWEASHGTAVIRLTPPTVIEARDQAAYPTAAVYWSPVRLILIAMDSPGLEGCVLIQRIAQVLTTLLA